MKKNPTHHNPSQTQPDDALPGPDALAEIRVRLLNFLKQIDHFQHEIARGFSGQLFIPALSPTAPQNMFRVRTCLEYHSRASTLLLSYLQLLFLASGRADIIRLISGNRRRRPTGGPKRRKSATRKQ